MNKTATTYNATDVWEVWLKKYLAENPKYWMAACTIARKKHKKIVYRVNTKTKNTEEVMTFDRWYKIVQVYFLMARKEVIKGKRIRLGHRLGAIQARTVARNFKNKQVDWGKTMKQPYTINPETGRRKFEKMIYHTSPTYSKIAWEKLYSIKHETYYKFSPSQGGKNRGGFQRDFINALRDNPLLETQYKQYHNELL
jgi:hypothetical protein